MIEKNGERVPVIAVLGHYGNRNLGEESIIAATLSGLRQAIPGVVPFPGINAAIGRRLLQNSPVTFACLQNPNVDP